MATTHSSHRRSLWFGGPSSPPPSSQEPQDFLKFNRYSSMPSASSLFEKLQDMSDIRIRATSKTTRDGKFDQRSLPKKGSSANLKASPNRLSTANGSLVGSIKGRLARKRSSPMLSSSSSFDESTPTVGSPTTPTGRGLPPLAMLGSPVSRYALDDTLSPSNANFDASKINYKGGAVGFRHLRRDSDNNSCLVDIVDVSKAGYRALSLTKKGCRLLHSYQEKDVSYIRSYNKVDLDNEAYNYRLLSRLNSTRSPSFHDYEVPPLNVLDLGCGAGHWVAQAAEYWGQYGTKITGFDLVDVVLEEYRALPSVSWKRGNFILYLLPFKTESFSLVRLSNLSDAVPQTRWLHVLSEVYRVLKPGGRIEIIDDELMFPYIGQSLQQGRVTPLSSKHPSRVHTARSSWSGAEVTSKSSSEHSLHERQPSQDYRMSFLELDVDSDAEEDGDSIAECSSVEPVPSLYRGHSPSEASADYLPTPTEGEAVDSVRRKTSRTSLIPSDSLQSSASLCHDIEGIYETMLGGRYGINPRPHEHIPDLLRAVFGTNGRVRMMHDFRISLLCEILDGLVASTRTFNPSNRDRKNKGWRLEGSSNRKEVPLEELERRMLDYVATTEAQMRGQGKALKMLGLGPKDTGPATPSKPVSHQLNDLILADLDNTDDFEGPSRQTRMSSSFDFPLSSTAERLDSPSKKRYYPHGLFVQPNLYLEMTPRELEMHLCKHVQNLLGSYAALEEHVLSLLNDEGEPIVTAEEWREMMWHYECTRLEHFNLSMHLRLGEGDQDDSDPFENVDALPRILPTAVVESIEKQTRTARTSSDPSSSGGDPATLVRRIRVFEAYKIV